MRDLHTHRGLGRVFHVEQSPHFESPRYTAKRPHRQLFHVEQLRKSRLSLAAKRLPHVHHADIAVKRLLRAELRQVVDSKQNK